jgi:hypothetical protein
VRYPASSRTKFFYRLIKLENLQKCDLGQAKNVGGDGFSRAPKGTCRGFSRCDGSRPGISTPDFVRIIPGRYT